VCQSGEGPNGPRNPGANEYRLPKGRGDGGDAASSTGPPPTLAGEMGKSGKAVAEGANWH